MDEEKKKTKIDRFQVTERQRVRMVHVHLFSGFRFTVFFGLSFLSFLVHSCSPCYIVYS